MFGFFKKTVSGKEDVRNAIKKEFYETVAVARGAPLSAQARVGKGILDALSIFNGKYTKETFANLASGERLAFMASLAKTQDELRCKGGDAAIEHIGYSLVHRWAIAAAMGDRELTQGFEEQMVYFKRAAETL